MNEFLQRPFQLHNPLQHYKWGTAPPDAFIPQLLGIRGKPNTPYAELWIGAHPSAPSKIRIENNLLPLNELVSRFPDQILGEKVAGRFNNRLPFLFKVLSAAESLSIQAHPTKGQAELLHKTDPEHYPDTNHKPEIAIALDSLSALAGFITVYQWGRVFQKYPEIADFFSKNIDNPVFKKRKLTHRQQSETLRQLYQGLIHLSRTKPSLYQRSVDRLAQRLKAQKTRHSRQERLFLESLEKYGNADIGLFTLFFLKMLSLKAGEAICITPGVPHAYLHGNIVECMANSDNVVRAGLTPKFKDINTLMRILNYTPNAVPIIKPEKQNNCFQYPVFTPEFQISRIHLSRRSQVFQTGGQIEIFLVIGGTGQLISRLAHRQKRIAKGQSYLIPATLPDYTINTRSQLTLFRVQIP